MKFTFLKPKKDNLPKLKSLRPGIFDIDSYWFLSLGLFLAIFIITALIGFKFFYSQYFETYKQSGNGEDFKNLIDINGLQIAIGKRTNFINATTTLPKDPSL